MNWFRSLFCQLGLVCAMLTSCMGLTSDEPAAPIYDVRSAVVLGGPNTPPELLSGIGDRINAAINATVRTEGYRRGVTGHRIDSHQKDTGEDRRRDIAKINIDAASVDEGSVIAVSSFEVTSTANDRAMADQILAEDIAARVRSAFKLNTGRG
ncbi:hypothetical protein C9413_15255 [Rhizobium sp. SEMIA 4085]|uniref:hypothetical protein n=1 Tax=Rhizobium sp. SEMIA 4085 TaxID=2137761 RepID=UPI0014788D02|nr:hypothetical protein [Rhizobium sp. SEMIA 4085]NNH30815.1 hypothetical protein [Rhizobium sp. SEMIA 4085]